MANAPRTEGRWFDPSVFQPAVGRGDRGNEAACNNRKIQLPGFHNHDVTFFKDFRLPKNQRITFKVEAYNLFNQVSWQSFDHTGQFNAAGVKSVLWISSCVAKPSGTVPPRSIGSNLLRRSGSRSCWRTRVRCWW